ncbi:MAG: nitroreductase family protein [Ilumatobacter sp.]|nr:nitroreductase family protein [Ilumatobacter sp.]
MTEFAEVVRARRMTRAFATTPIASTLLDDLVDLAARAPSAGKVQGWHLVVLEGADTERFWNVTLPPERRDTFRWQRLLDAPVIALPFADAGAYVDRYAEPDKEGTGLGDGPDAWPAPYWTIDASMAVMTLLLAAEDVGLGALFFGVFHDADRLRAELGVPADLELLGALALGHRAGDAERGRSAARSRRTPGEIIHRGRW